MPRFLIRTNCEYSIEVETDTAERAERIAEEIDLADAAWSKAWAPFEVEEA